MNTTRIDYSLALKQIILEFVNELKKVFPPTDRDVHSDLQLMEFFFKNMEPNSLFKHLVKEVLPHVDQIKARDDKFFLNNKSVFAGLPEKRIKEISIAWETGKIDKENKDVIWEYFDTIVKLVKRIKM